MNSIFLSSLKYLFARIVSGTHIGMPGEDAYSLIRQVRAMETGKKGEKIPAVALTGYAGTQDRRRALRAGFQMHLSKPVEPIDLATAITILVRGSE